MMALRYAVRLAVRHGVRRGRITREQAEPIYRALSLRGSARQRVWQLVEDQVRARCVADTGRQLGFVVDWKGWIDWLRDHLPELVRIVLLVLSLVLGEPRPGLAAEADNTRLSSQAGEKDPPGEGVGPAPPAPPPGGVSFFPT